MLLKKSTYFILVIIFLSMFIPLIVCSQNDSPPVDSSLNKATLANDTSAVVQDTSQTGKIAGTKEQSLYPMSPERKAKLISYSRFNNIWRFVDFLVGIGILCLILFTGLSAKLRDWAQVVHKKFFVVWFYLILFLLVNYIFNFPFDIYRNFFVENQYGFNHLTFWGWWKEGLLSLGLTMIIGIIPLWFLYRLMEKLKRWWLWFSLGAIPFLVFFIIIAPVVISPLFNKFEPLKNKELKQMLLQEANKAGIEGAKVFQVNASKQSSKINAYVTGLLGTKRIVLYDNLIDNFTPEEIKFVMGHEMGHYVMHHVWKGLLVAILFILFALWLTNKTIYPVINRFKTKLKFDRLSDIASLPLILLYFIIISFVFDPVTNGLSRHFEHQADIFGMNISGVSGEVAAKAFDKLSVYNLADPDPNPIIEFWFYDHPALKKRMEFVRHYHQTK
ncbi:MAG: M48 family metallopeptidase [FCB group bacterium]|nr:M48 family metallopeptidase [FCB group bacterium]